MSSWHDFMPSDSSTILSRFSWQNVTSSSADADLLKDRVNPDVIPLNDVVLEKYLFAARTVLFLGSDGATYLPNLSLFKPQRLLDTNATTPNHIVT
ncbi:hypothetical protein BGAL_0048g00420 [Botrytis galanthina]|uniref:Uncharacterized protein n=1 Tax=Botrytis galanthina TaxID=278940 RepID=A0A4S8RAU8_9HELO|nr:hypothetical protein BGAL_0048g00420 [Botrytis galanthina]